MDAERLFDLRVIEAVLAQPGADDPPVDGMGRQVRFAEPRDDPFRSLARLRNARHDEGAERCVQRVMHAGVVQPTAHEAIRLLLVNFEGFAQIVAFLLGTLAAVGKVDDIDTRRFDRRGRC